MSRIELSKQLSVMITSLVKSFLIFYKMYGPWLKAIAAVLLAYLAFRVGRKSVVDKLQQDVKRIEKVLKERHLYSIELPERLNKIVSARKLALGLTIALGMLLVVKSLKVKVKWLKWLTATFSLQLFLLFCLLLITIWSYEIWLDWSIKKGTSTSIHINQELFSLTKQIGAKVLSALRLHLCKEKLISRKKYPAGVCRKEDCNQIRSYLKLKEQLIERLVMHGITFEWCSSCNNRKQFQQYLPFEALLYAQDKSLPQQQEVSTKNSYLISELLRMCSWIKNLGPCNCSKLYWQSELKQVRLYKEGEREIQDRFRVIKLKKGL